MHVWCDNDDEQGDLHTSFKLSGGGEFLGIVAPDGITYIDSLTFGTQQADISIGRMPDGYGSWIIQEIPTPGYQNHHLDCLMPADVNCDQMVDILDVVIIVAWILDETLLTPEQLLLSDINDDGSLDVVDIVLIIGMILG